MKEEMQYIRERVDGIAGTLARNTAILEANTESLKEHMRRTELLEQNMETALLPIRAAKILGYILGLLGTIGGAILAWSQYSK